MTRRKQVLALPCLAAALLAACGAGVAGVAASAGDGGGGGAPPAIAAFAVDFPKEPARATVRFTLSKRATVELLFRPPNGTTTPMTKVGANPREFDAGPQAIPWSFADEPGLAATFQPEVLVFARIPGVLDEPRERENALTLELGNDPPVVHAIEPMPTDPLNPEESAGNVEVRLRISDTSSDPVDVVVEWRRAGDPPDSWNLGTAAGVFPDGIETSRAPGVELSFFWNTNADLRDEESTVFFRVTANDRTEVGAPLETQSPFRVDNNDEPIVAIDTGFLLANPDQRRGIPIPFTARDEEGDRVEVIFQWRRAGESFPAVTDSEIDAILNDPILRREKQICTPYPRHARGRVVPVDPSTVVLPELALGESWILATGLEGRALELLRPSSIPAPPDWNANHLVAPVAALPLGDGLTALVLDTPGRLSEIELATGVVVREIAAWDSGIPTALAAEVVPGRGVTDPLAVLVALDDGASARIERVALASGEVIELIAPDGSLAAPVRGIASLGRSAAALTSGSELLFLEYGDPLAPRLGALLTGLAIPWGVVADPLDKSRLYLAEREAATTTGTGRILAVRLEGHEAVSVEVRTRDGLPANLASPSALALERGGTRMIVVTNGPGGTTQLVGLELGARGGNVSYPIGAPRTGSIASIAAGPDGLRVAAAPASGELLVAGGVEQRREIVAYDPHSRRATLEAALRPEPDPVTIWRIPHDRRLRATVGTGLETYLWDAATDLPGGGPAFLRALSRDDELRVAADSSAAKPVRAALDVPPLELAGPGTNPSSLAIGDLDNDGDMDIVSANGSSHDVTVHYQASSGRFDPVPVPRSASVRSPRSVAVGDLDGDGDRDIVTANRDSNNLTVFLQGTTGSFDSAPLVLGMQVAPLSVAIGDLDGDLDLDVVSANLNAGSLTVFFQDPPGVFEPTPLVLRSSATSLPQSVAIGDLDGDGDQDLVSANTGNGPVLGNLTVFFQRSPGVFDPAPVVLGGVPETDGARSVAIGDLDGDGDQDLVSTNFVSDTLTAFFQSSPGGFDPTPVQVAGRPIINNPQSVAIGDLDGDGDEDIVYANDFGDNLSAFFQTLPGSFDPVPFAIGSFATSDAPVSVAIGDLDGDGDPDLVSANAGSGGDELDVFLQASRGSFGPAPLAIAGPDPVSVAIGDLDGDGNRDLVAANEFTGHLDVFFQRSTGSFDPAPLRLPVGEFPLSVALGDLDDDGDQDLVSANARPFNGRSRGLTLFFQRSSASFDPVPLALAGLARTDAPRLVAIGDLDVDGDQDLVAANETGQLIIFFQVSPGSFIPDFGLAPVGPRSVAIGDIDGDGSKDLVTASPSSDGLAVFFQDSPGSFASDPLLLSSPTMDFPVSVVVGDLDYDGREDLVSANLGSNDLSVFFQNSSESFELPLVLGGSSITHSPASVAIGDVDGDGDLDVVSGNELGNNLAVFLHGSPRSFLPTLLLLGGPSTTADPESVAIGDLDGDGEEDIVSANENSNSLTVFWGGR